MISLRDQEEKEKFYFLLMVFCHRIFLENPGFSDVINAIRKKAEEEYRLGALFAESKGENMREKYLTPFKEIAKNFKVTVKGTPEERTKRQLETYLSMDKERKTTNAALLQK